MRLGQKHTSSVSEAILKEQRQLRMERLLASPGLIIGLVGFLVILLTAVLIPLFSSVDPNAMVVSERLKPPSGEHFFGTDELGRDLFTRIMYGARVSLWVGGSVAVFSCILGIIFGLYASAGDVKLERDPCARHCIYAKCCKDGSCQRYGHKGTDLCGSGKSTGIQ